MGIFNVFKSIGKMARAGGNFKYIAQNVATIYYAIGETSFGKTLNEEKRLFATGLIDAVAYLIEGSLTEDDITECVVLARLGEVRLGFYSKKHTLSFCEFEENGYLVGLAMQLEALFFNADTNVEYHDIVDQVVAHKRIIAKMINKTLESGNGSPLYPDYKNNVELFLSSPANKEVIERFSVSEYLNRGINTKD